MIQDMYGLTVKTIKWTTDTDSNNAIKMTDSLAESMEDNIAVQAITFQVIYHPTMKAHTAQNRPMISSPLKLDVS